MTTIEQRSQSEELSLPVTNAPTRNPQPADPLTATLILLPDGPPTSRGIVALDKCAMAQTMWHHKRSGTYFRVSRGSHSWLALHVPLALIVTIPLQPGPPQLPVPGYFGSPLPSKARFHISATLALFSTAPRKLRCGRRQRPRSGTRKFLCLHIIDKPLGS